MLTVVLLAVLFLAWTNGANDNFKGVATLYGAGTLGYRRALAWATAATAAGALLAPLLAAGLIKTFSAKGLVPDAVAASPAFLGAAALAAAATVLAATVVGMPVSTTHALTGALCGAGLASGAPVDVRVLGKGFVLPLLLSPVVATAIAAALYVVARASRRALGVEKQSCVCIGEELVVSGAGDAAAAERVRLAVAAGAKCVDRYQGAVVGVSAQNALDGLHVVSAGAVCFARALNDTPKIAGVLLGAKALGAGGGIPAVALAMAVGGVLGARRVAETMAKKIVPLNAGQGFVANLTTAGLVIAASLFKLPVSTTHVATGGLFGIGTVTGQARGRTVLTIVGAWLTTLPVGLAFGAAAMLALR